MGRLTVTFEKWEVAYLPSGKLIEANEKIRNFDELEDRLLAGHTRMRRILVRLMPKWPLVCYYLHWSDGTDLERLDSRVVSGEYTLDDFNGALLGEVADVRCSGCGATRRVVASEPSVPFFSDQLERGRQHAYLANCPACGTRWTVSVLEYVDEH